jgi:hypothetical protein
MRYPGKWPAKGMAPVDNIAERVKAADLIRVRGTPKIPPPPRDVVAQSAPRGIFLTWNLPTAYYDIVGWRIYKNDELTLFGEIHDRGTRQEFVETTAGSPSVTTNCFVSAINRYGKESVKVQVQGAAANEAGSPTMPNTPPQFNKGWAGGGNTTTGSGRYRTE